MKHLCTLLLSLYVSLIFSQVGINTPLPNATLEVTGQPSDILKMDGLITPRITGDQLRAKTYTTSQNGAIVYVTTKDSAPSGQTVEVLNPGYYFFNGDKWVGMATSNAFVPNVVAAGRSTSTIVQNSSTNYTKWNFTVTRNDGNWNTATNSYTIPSSGYYQLSLSGKVMPNTTGNAFTWLVMYGTERFDYSNFVNYAANVEYNRGGVIVLYLIQGTVVHFGGFPCTGCTGSYTVGERTFSIVSLGS